MLGTRHILLSSGRLKYTALRVHDGVERTGGHRMIDRPLKTRSRASGLQKASGI